MLVKALLAAGANVKRGRDHQRSNRAPMWAISEGHRDVRAQRFLMLARDVQCAFNGSVHAAACSRRVGGDIELARMLLAAGADIDAKGSDGSTRLARSRRSVAT